MIRNRTYQAANTRRAILTTVAVLVFDTASASAGPVIVTFSGHLTETLSPAQVAALGYDPSIAVGAMFQGSFEYDPNTVLDDLPDPNLGRYSVGTTIIGQVGEVIFEAHDLFVGVFDDRTIGASGPLDNILVAGYAGSLGASPLSGVQVHLGGPASILSSDALPLILNLDEFADVRSFALGIPISNDDPIAIARGTITMIRITPEPSLAVAAALAACAILRQRRSSASSSHGHRETLSEKEI